MIHSGQRKRTQMSGGGGVEVKRGMQMDKGVRLSPLRIDFAQIVGQIRSLGEPERPERLLLTCVTQ